VEAQNRIIHSTSLLDFFTTRDWKFKTENFEALMLTQSEEEKEMYVVVTRK
jgi:hypothetical protein